MVLVFSWIGSQEEARAEPAPARMPAAVLWLGAGAAGVAGAGDAEKTVAAIGRALLGSKQLRPIEDAEARHMLVAGGPRARVDEKLAEGKARFAALSDLGAADASLGEAEAIALAELPSEVACARLVEVERLRLRYAELVKGEEPAVRAAMLLGACEVKPTEEDAAAIARHPARAGAGSAGQGAVSRQAGQAMQIPGQAGVRIESEPVGAEVRLDLRLIGKTPMVLPEVRRGDAFVDVELPGYRKVHRAVPAAGTLSVALAKDDRVGELIDRVREAAGNAPESDFAEIGRRVGAARLLVLRRGDGALQARVLEVATAAWTKLPIAIDAKSEDDAAVQAVALLAAKPESDSLAARTQRPAQKGAAGAGGPAGAVGPAAAGTAQKGQNMQGAGAALGGKDATAGWKHWYTWVVGGALVVGVGAFVIANHVGDDQVTIHVSH